MSESPLLEVEGLTIQYDTSDGPLTAVSDASFSISQGENFGLAGESGCGKTTTAESIIGMLDDNGRVESGVIRYKGDEIQDYSESKLNEKIRMKEISYIPQSSMNNLDPLETIEDQAVAIGRTHTDLGKKEIRDTFADAMERVGISRNRLTDYPHEFSGGMQQRAIIALALFLQPSLIIADEPTTALDVIMQDQILKYLEKVSADNNISTLMITHDIAVIFETCDAIGIMHGGQFAEIGDVRSVHNNPGHPYSMALKQAFPDIRHPDRKLTAIEGYPPEIHGEHSICSFYDRCPWAIEDCATSQPPLEPMNGAENQYVACIRKEEIQENETNE